MPNVSSFWRGGRRWDKTAHVLFYENKPVCLSALVLKDKYQTFKNIQCLKGWRAFRKHEHLFPHPNFIIDQHIVDFSDKFRALHIYIINKQSLAVCLKKNQALFRESLGQDFMPDQFLAKLKEGGSLPTLVNHNDVLLGVLLGYGEESARAFNRANANHSKDYAPPETKTYRAIQLDQPKGCKIFPVIFMGNPNSPEVRQLSTIYEKELEEIWQAYKSSKNRLNMVLQGLCAE